MRADAMNMSSSRRTRSLGARFTLAALAVAAAFAVPAIHAQDKSTSVSKVERLNRAPVNKEILRVKLPVPTTVKLPNGLTLLLLEDHKLPTIAFTMWIRPGQLADPNELPGLASFTADMLREGTERRTSSQIAAEVDSLGASLSADSRFGASYTSVNGSGLIDSASQILDLMSDIVLHPAFPEAELAKYKQRQAAVLEERLSNPTFLGQQMFRRVLYGDAPLSVASPTKESIEKATRDDLKKFRDQHYRPGNTILGVTGDFKPAEMRAMVDKYFSAWTGKAEAPLAFPAVVTLQPARITLVDRPASVQTYIIGGGQSIRRTDPIYPTLAVMNQVLGGGAQARLFLDLREEHGYTYGANSSYAFYRGGGPFVAGGLMRTNITADAVKELLYEIKRFPSNPPTDAELKMAKDARVQSLPGQFETTAATAGALSSIYLFDRPLNYYATLPEKYTSVTAAEVARVAKDDVHPDQLVIVAVGDRAKIEPALKELNIAPVEYADPTGNIIK